MWPVTEMSLLHPVIRCHEPRDRTGRKWKVPLTESLAAALGLGVLGVPSCSAVEKTFGGHWHCWSSYTGAMKQEEIPTVSLQWPLSTDLALL